MEAFGTNKRIAKVIDKTYDKGKLRYYTLAKNSEFYNHPIIADGDIFKEVYGKKALGILLDSQKSEDTADELIRIIKKGWPQILNYIENNENINFIDYVKEYLQNRPNMTDDIFNSELTMLYWLTLLIYNKKPDNTADNMELLRQLEKTLLERQKFYNQSGNVPRAPEFRQRVEEEYGKLRCYDDIFFRKHGTKTKNLLESLSIIFDSEKMSISSLIGDKKYSTREIDEIYGAYQAIFKNQNREKGHDFIIVGIVLRGLIKAYKELKDYYFKNNKETVLLEMQSQQDTIEKLKRENNYLQDKIKVLEGQVSRIAKDTEAQYINQVQELKKKIKDLEIELAEEKKKENELFALRELLFSLEHEEEDFKSEEESINIDNIKGVIVGGHEKWQQRMKALLPNFTFYKTDTENIDPNAFNNIDIIFFYTKYLSHSLYYRIINIARAKSINLGYINTTNEDRAISSIKSQIRNIPKLKVK